MKFHLKLIIIVLVIYVIFTPIYASEIHEAVKIGDVESIKRLLKENPKLLEDASQTNENRGFTPLHFAVFYNQDQAAKILIQNGANVNSIESQLHWTPLYFALKQNNEKIAKFLLENGAAINVTDINKFTPLHITCNIRITKMLLNYRADVNAINIYGHTPLFSILSRFSGGDRWRKKSISISQLYNIDLFEFNEISMDEELHSYIQMMVNHRTNLSLSDINGETVLFPLVMCKNLKLSNREDIVLLFLSKNLDIRGQDNEGNTILHKAAIETAEPEFISFLINKGASVNDRNLNDETPLHCAVKRVDEDVLISLLKNTNADVNARDKSGRTPLFMVAVLTPDYHKIMDGFNGQIRAHINFAYYPSQQFIDILLAHGADINCRDNQGLTPLGYAEKMHNMYLIEYLKKKGATL